jgi:hypothetical protein
MFPISLQLTVGVHALIHFQLCALIICVRFNIFQFAKKVWGSVTLMYLSGSELYNHEQKCKIIKFAMVTLLAYIYLQVFG